MNKLVLYSWINLFIVGSYFVNTSGAIRCYVCGEEENSEPCSEFQTWDSRFIRICEDKGSRSCKTTQRVSDKKVLSRSCESIPVTDCKVANSIEFCFCTEDLCNIGQDRDAVDDESTEDIVEGSGHNTVHQKTSTPEPDILVDISVTKKPSVSEDTGIESNTIPSDQRYLSSCITLQSNVYLSGNMLLFLYLVCMKQ